jgi:glutathione synthase/RimK-type ligase-like ATP-grasp enzyme
MIFIITHKDDFTVDFVIEKLNKRNISYYRFNCEDIDEKGYTFKLGKTTKFSINNINNIDSVWFRRTKLPEINTSSDSEKLFILNDYDTLLSNIYNLIESDKWMSKPKNVYNAENKLLQLRIAKEIDFITPETIVTSSKEDLNQFLKEHNNQVIIKPINQGRINETEGFKNIFTNILSLEHINNLDKYDLTPSIFQSYIEKEYEIRVTVVDGKVFSAKVESQQNEKTKIDWRKEKLKFTEYKLPDDISEKCLSLVKILDLNFGAIDLIKSKKGEYVFLEINPNGQWAWIEFDTNLKISEAIISFLTHNKYD